MTFLPVCILTTIVAVFVCQIVVSGPSPSDSFNVESLALAKSFFSIDLSSSMATLKSYHDPPARVESPPQSSAGTFNGVDVSLVRNSRPRFTHVHCAGENYLPDAWKQRSCHYDFLCLNTSSRKFVAFQSDHEAELSRLEAQLPFWHTASTLTNSSVAIGSLESSWHFEKLNQMEWSPEIFPSSMAPSSYYLLPSNVVLAPLYSSLFTGANTASGSYAALMDDILPVYILLEMFGLVNKHVLPIRGVAPKGSELPPSECPKDGVACQKHANHLARLLWEAGFSDSWKYSTLDGFNFQKTEDGVPFVCSEIAVAGVGPLADHSILRSSPKLRLRKVSVLTHNHGRGGLYWRFRNFVLRNLQLPSSLPQMHTTKVVVAYGAKIAPQHSSIVVEYPNWNSLDLLEQIRLISRSSLFVTTGEHCQISLFLPPGAGLIVVDSERQHWDMVNSLSHIRVHWTSSPEAIGGLIEKELNSIRREKQADVDNQKRV